MKKQYSIKQRITSGVLALLMVLAYLPLLMLPVMADEGKVADVSTMDYWKNFFGSSVPSTQYAGAVWTDKSVFTDAENFKHLVDENGDPRITLENYQNFLVALSAIASNKEITGYTNIPTDTVLVLDVSGSMNDNQGNNDAVEELVTAANLAIKELTSVNNYNRIGIVLYSGGGSNAGQVLLPLGRYSHNNDEFLVRTTSYNGGTEYVTVNSGVTDENGDDVSGSKAVSGGTYIQAGIYSAMEMLLDVDDTTIQSGMQAGTKRMPVMVLMSDGAPTYATNYYAGSTSNRGPNAGQVTWPASNLGDGSNPTDLLGFLTQLTASYAKGKIEEHYDNNSLFYTLGFAVGNSGIARSVLDPSKMTEGMTEWWNDYEALEEDGNLVVDGSGRNQKVVTTNDYVTGRYYTDGYYSASNKETLVSAFTSIVNEIKLQSLYLPTNIGGNTSNYGGYIEFVDDIGEYMEIKHIEGVLAGNTLFSGANLAKHFTNKDTFFGTPEDPTETGNEFVWAVIDRLGLDEKYDTYEEQRAEARSIINLAFAHGQLSYTNDTEFSNYIGWYADKDGNYLGVWAEEHTAEDVPANAVYINRSYGMLGSYKDGLRESDLMYMSIQVHTEIASGHSQLIWRIPAALVPIVTYSVTMQGDDLDDPGNVTVEIKDAEPIRLIYEVGLRSDINAYNIVEKLGDSYRNADGTYTFYTNQWNLEDYNDPDKFATEDVNTTSHFEPSEENERYYYSENTTVYRKTLTGYEKYTGTASPTGSGYYHKEYVFEITDAASGAATVKENYVAISDTTIELAVSDNGEWYIPMGTIKRYEDVSPNAKNENITGTIPNSHTPKIEFHDDSDLSDGNQSYYYADVVLGNNGKLTVEPITGLSVQKVIDGTITNTETEYEFTVESANSSENGAYNYVKLDADGMPIAGTHGVIKFNSGKSDVVKVKAGEDLTISDLPVGKYTVYEVESEDYRVSKINGDAVVVNYGEVEVTEHEISDIVFENTLRTTGNVIIHKEVVHPLGDDYAIPEDLRFEFEVKITDKQGNPAKNKEYLTSISSTPAITNVDGILLVNGHNVRLAADQAITVYNVDEGYTVTVSEINMKEGFTADDAVQSAVVTTDSNAVLTFINTYAPDNAYPVNIEIKGEKELSGRDWLAGDEFYFELQRYDPATATWNRVGETQKVDINNKTFDFTKYIKDEVYSKVGTYHYRVVELYDPYDAIGGITYDNGSRVFNVVVTDTTMDGVLEIGTVTVSAPTTVVYNANDSVWEVRADFINTYTVRGTATVTVEISKSVVSEAGVDYSPEGFEFGIFSGNTILGNTVKTDANGKATLTLTFGANQVGNTYSYTIKEIHGTVDGIIYTDVEYEVEISIIDNLEGGIEAVIYDATPDDSIPSGAYYVYDAEFVNTYKPDHTEVSISGTKILEGLGLKAGDFEFELYDITNDVTVQIVSNDENGKFVFDNLIFEAIGTYEYKVTEIAGNNPGIRYDIKEYFVIVNVTAVGGALHAEVSITENNAAATEIVFENFYSTVAGESTEITIEGDKNLSGKDLEENEFEFILKDKDGNKVQSVKNDADGKFTFDPLYFYNAGEFIYYVSEIKGDNPGITYDDKEYKIVVTVTEDGQGGLIADYVISLGDDSVNEIVFNNTYAIVSGTMIEIELEGNKTVSGMTLEDGDFEFELVESDGTVISRVSNAKDGKFIFDAVVFDIPDTRTYTVREVKGDNLGITYDNTVYTVIITATDNGRGGLDYTVTYKKGDTVVDGIAFHNTYEVKDDAVVSVPLDALKTVEGMILNAGDFSFVLKDRSGAVLQTVSNAANGYIEFAPILLDRIDAYVYYISEVKGDNAGITYDETVYTVMIVVFDDGMGGLDYTVTVNNGTEEVDEIIFKNTYAIRDDAKVTVDLGATKTLKGMTLAKDMFDFVIKSEDGKYSETVKNTADGKITFTTLSFDKIGTYVYTVSEIKGTNDGITYDTTIYTVTIVIEDDGNGGLKQTTTIKSGNTTVSAMEFENAYSIDDDASVTVSISATKTLSGMTLEANAFSFVLKNGEGNEVETVKNTAAGKISFTDLKFTEVGTYTYTVSEVKENKGGITYDETVYTITVVVEDNGNGGLKYTKTVKNATAEVEAIVFNNSYAVSDDAFVTVKIDASKKLTGKTLEKDMFEFVLKNKDGKAVETVKNGKDGAISFTEIKLTEAGTYVYTVSEVVGSDKRMTYDTAVYTVTVVVEDDQNGGLKKSVTVTKAGKTDDKVEFTNVYTPKPADITVEIDITKTVENLGTGTITPEGFEFILKDLAGVAADLKVVSDANGKAKIVLTYTENDAGKTFKYTLSEVNGGVANVTYSEAVYQIEVKVELGADNKLMAALKNNNTATDKLSAEFVNTYNFDIPVTGDTSNLILFAALTAVSGITLVCAATYAKRRREMDVD